MAWILSQFLHGEQGALLATAQIVDAVPVIDAKLYAATQVMDEARHVEVYDRYLREKLEKVYPINPHLKTLLDQILTDSRWDMKYLGMQILVEGLALAAFGFIRAYANEPLLRDLTHYVMRDEARHVAFGVLSLRDFYAKNFTAAEMREREEFTYEGCVLMRDRFLARDVWEEMGLPVDECCDIALESPSMLEFRRMLFSKIVPNVKKLGLLDDWLRERFAELGILQYEDLEASAEASRPSRSAASVARRARRAVLGSDGGARRRASLGRAGLDAAAPRAPPRLSRLRARGRGAARRAPDVRAGQRRRGSSTISTAT